MFCSIAMMIANITFFQLPRSNKACPKCKAEDAVFFQSQQRSAETGMVLLSLFILQVHADDGHIETLLCLLWVRPHLPVIIYPERFTFDIGVGDLGGKHSHRR